MGCLKWAHRHTHARVAQRKRSTSEQHQANKHKQNLERNHSQSDSATHLRRALQRVRQRQIADVEVSHGHWALVIENLIQNMLTVLNSSQIISFYYVSYFVLK